jgi:hypothetical protein
MQFLPATGKTIIFSSSPAEFYYDGLYLQDPFMQSPFIVARDLGEKNKELINRYPDANIYVWDGQRLLARKRFSYAGERDR